MGVLVAGVGISGGGRRGTKVAVASGSIVGTTVVTSVSGGWVTGGSVGPSSGGVGVFVAGTAVVGSTVTGVMGKSPSTCTTTTFDRADVPLPEHVPTFVMVVPPPVLSRTFAVMTTCAGLPSLAVTLQLTLCPEVEQEPCGEEALRSCKLSSSVSCTLMLCALELLVFAVRLKLSTCPGAARDKLPNFDNERVVAPPGVFVGRAVGNGVGVFVGPLGGSVGVFVGGTAPDVGVSVAPGGAVATGVSVTRACGGDSSSTGAVGCSAGAGSSVGGGSSGGGVSVTRAGCLTGSRGGGGG